MKSVQIGHFIESEWNIDDFGWFKCYIVWNRPILEEKLINSCAKCKKRSKYLLNCLLVLFFIENEIWQYKCLWKCDFQLFNSHLVIFKLLERKLSDFMCDIDLCLIITFSCWKCAWVRRNNRQCWCYLVGSALIGQLTCC